MPTTLLYLGYTVQAYCYIGARQVIFLEHVRLKL